MAKRKSKVLADGGPAREEQSRGKKSTTVVEEANQLSFLEFKEQYWISDREKDAMMGERFATDMELFFAGDMKPEQLEECLKLVETTSRPDYENSSWGWHANRKRKEMKEKEMRYVILWQRPVREGQPSTMLGFLSFMLTHDSTPAVPVLYVYEIHLAKIARRRGLGYALMNVARGIASKVGVEKVMLTCFLSNTAALEFYRNLGFKKDVCSPEDRRTRNKVVKTDYMIMSEDVVKVKEEEVPERTVQLIPSKHDPRVLRAQSLPQPQRQTEAVKIKVEAQESEAQPARRNNVPQVSRAPPPPQPQRQTNPQPPARHDSLTIPAILQGHPAALNRLGAEFRRHNIAVQGLGSTLAAVESFNTDHRLTQDAPLMVCQRSLKQQLAFLQESSARAETLLSTLNKQTTSIQGAIKHVDNVIASHVRQKALDLEMAELRQRERMEKERAQEMAKEKARQEKTRFGVEEILDRWFQTTVEAGAFSDLVKHEHIEEDVVSGFARGGVIKTEPAEE
ncbi:unnamed protein product [Zymoseptoria tritici ST99CH_3D1]|uniref:N-alpha-acetyltransferase 40 n=1 Tax=Zymoseptoria tritici ST99CH_1E4 TaxID=1276532 RepID=A0A2H1GG84_ZYMTR|nr:unnamed protein product [Zymoseptoria tritici ST99CH_1E4]SMR53768.1 unnamed protein product [Zymoseptoria tritici ST99CH_3D1]